MTGFVAGAKALGAIFGFAQKAEELTQSSNDRVAGANEVVAKDLKAENDADQKALKAAVDDSGKPVSDSLRNGSF